MPAPIPAAKVGTRPKEQFFVMMAQLGSCSSSQSLLSYLHVLSLCPATPKFDSQAAHCLKSPLKANCKQVLMQCSPASPGQKQPQLWGFCFLLPTYCCCGGSCTHCTGFPLPDVLWLLNAGKAAAHLSPMPTFSRQIWTVRAGAAGRGSFGGVSLRKP